MQWSQLRTIDIYRPQSGKRYSMLPVDHIDVTGFNVSYNDSPLRPEMLDIAEGDRVTWRDKTMYYRAEIDEIVIDGRTLRAAFRDAQPFDPDGWTEVWL